MKKNIKKRLVSFICIVCMLCSMFVNMAPVSAETGTSEDITLDTAPEREFAHWTFSDVDIPNENFGNRWDNTNHTTGNTLDMTLFQGKIKFPSVGSQFFIGANVDSKYNGIRFINSGTELSLAFSGVSSNFYDENGNTGNQADANKLVVFDPTIAGTTLIGNDKLEVAVSVEYTDVTNGFVDMKVGVFFDGKLYDNKYFTVKDVPETYLKQTIRFQNSDTSVKWYAESIIELEKAPEREFAPWTFSDVNIPNGYFGLRWDDIHTTGNSLDKTLFQGKIKFPNYSSDFVIGAKDTSNNRGFRFLNDGTTLSLAFSGTDGHFYNAKGDTESEAETGKLAVFDPAIAGTTLIGNDKLEVAVSVEYTDVTDGLVDMKVGVFFDGRLYNGTYFTVADAPETYLKQTIRFRNSDSVNYKWYAESIVDIETAPENQFSHWTFSDVDIPDAEFSSRWTETNHTTGESLDKTLFLGKIRFPSVDSQFIIGEKEQVENGSGYRGFRFFSDGTNLSLAFSGTEGHFYNAKGDTESEAETGKLANFDPTIAGTTLIGNDKLEVAVSVEYTEVTDGLVDMKVGVFFDGRLYNGTYFTVANAPETYLKQTIRFKNSSDSAKWYAESIENTLGTVLESKFTHWTFSDVNIPDAEFGNRWENTNHTTGQSLNKTLFQGKIKFPSVSSQFFIGANVDSKYNGIRFINSGTELSLAFSGVSSNFYDENGNTGNQADDNKLVVFDPTIAGTTLIGNDKLEVAVSVEYTDTTDGLVTMKLGVFFDGKLYNDTYFTVKNVPETYLTQTIRFQSNDTENYKWYAESVEDYEMIVHPEITDSIAMNYTVTIAPYILESGMPKMCFTMNGCTTEEIEGTKVGDNAYEFAYPDIMAQNIADTITARLTVGGHIKTYEYSVLNYCADVLNAATLKYANGVAYSSKQMAALKDLVVDLVEYGAEVQKYRKPSIAEADLLTTKLGSVVSGYDTYDTKDDTAIGELTGVVDSKLSGEESDKYQWKSVTLVLGNKVKIRCKFTAKDASNLTVKTTIDDEAVVFTETSEAGVYTFDIDNIYANEYAKEIQIRFYEGEAQVGQTLNYSVNTYLDSKKDSEYKDLLLAIHNYGNAAVEFASSQELRVLFSSDVHYTDLISYEYWFNDKDQRMQYWVDCVNAEHEKDPIDLLVINGDISLDYWSEGGSVRKNGAGTTADFVKDYLSKLPKDLPVFVMPGNHEQYSDAKWYELTENHRQGAMALNDTLFLFMDNYNADLDPIKDSDGTYTPTDVEYINTMMAKYPLCDVYLVGHYFDYNAESSAFKQLVAENSRIKGLFAGHTHKASTITLGADWGSKTIAQTGNFANTAKDDFWGFRELLITLDSTYSQFVKVPKDNTTDVKNTTFERINKIVYEE